MRFWALATAALITAPHWVLAEPVFLQHRVADPINLLTAIPALSSSSTSAFQIQAAVSHVNVFAGGIASSSSGTEVLLLDGEITELELRGQFALGSCFSAAFDTRVVSHSAGVFDETIDQWHNIFGLPDADRDEGLFDQLDYAFFSTSNFDLSGTDFSTTQTQFSSPSTSFGDVWLSLLRPTQCNRTAGLRTSPTSGHVRVGVKLPVGSTSGWASGGQAAVFADWHSLPKSIGKRARITTTFGASYSNEWDERFAVLTPRRLLGYGAVVFDYRWNSSFQSVVQLDFRSATFDSELTELGQFGAQFHIGLRASLAREHRFELSLSEDAIIDTAPDVGVRFAYTYVPRAYK